MPAVFLCAINRLRSKGNVENKAPLFPREGALCAREQAMPELFNCSGFLVPRAIRKRLFSKPPCHVASEAETNRS
ncbi:hypothetical protein CEXT_571781 [Caerostris extrusa]|uniref:Uncharacterized protein n=1 Tax=Caerostris extrusa TaxID=172846 RepID=A0AAV4PHQ4_CAEEX|nr:hypothetical protein CEXT_571781 [Caerostris extrusa]